MATNKGTVKKTNLSAFTSVRKSGMLAMALDEGEELISVRMTDGNSEILMATRGGLAIHFGETDVREMGRPAHGVRGILLNRKDEVVAMDTITDPAAEVLTITENGMAKRTRLEEYTKQIRGGKGRINYNLTDKTGDVAGMAIVHPEDELYIITASGIIMVTGVSDISQIGRNTQGVKAISLNEGDKVTGIATVEPEEKIMGGEAGKAPAAPEESGND
jgi:DNA gyrase subunit A